MFPNLKLETGEVPLDEAIDQLKKSVLYPIKYPFVYKMETYPPEKNIYINIKYFLINRM